MKTTTLTSSPGVQRSRWLLRGALVLTTSLVVWAEYARIDQIAHARGQVIAASRTQVVQSPDGGVLKELLVKEGDRVQRGQLVATTEKERARAAYSDSLAKVAALKIALTRLRAEVYGTPLVFDRELLDYPDFIATQTDLYKKRQQVIMRDVEVLTESLRLAKEELAMNEPLNKSGDIGYADVLRLRRQVVDIKGQIENRRNKYFQDAQAEMTKAEEELSTQEQALAERKAMLDHTELRAPTDGIVKNIRITTVGGVVRTGESVMEILPTDSDLIVEAKIPPIDLSFIRPGQPATVKLDAYDYSIFGSMRGEVSYISADALTEETRNGEQPYYRVRIRIGERDFKGERAKQIVISPGMTVSVDINTGDRTVLSYLTKPITKTMSASLSER